MGRKSKESVPPNDAELEQYWMSNGEEFLFDQICILIHRMYDLENEVKKLKKLAV